MRDLDGASSGGRGCREKEGQMQAASLTQAPTNQCVEVRDDTSGFLENFCGFGHLTCFTHFNIIS